MRDLLRGIEELRAVTTSATLKEFNLARRLKSCASTLGLDHRHQLIFDGREDLVAVGDPNLLTIAFCNGLRNAIEASTSVREAPVVVVAWGETDVDFWVTIIDQGPGIGSNSESAFNLGATTKRGHRGFGLAIARQAMLTIDGSISLRPNKDEGSTFELRWFK
jgi:signal transduction histidine kinase